MAGSSPVSSGTSMDTLRMPLHGHEGQLPHKCKLCSGTVRPSMRMREPMQVSMYAHHVCVLRRWRLACIELLHGHSLSSTHSKSCIHIEDERVT